jgi:hypothetical protein
MTKTNCIVCKVSHIASEVRKHPNWVTIWWLNYFMKRVRERLKKDIARICEAHRNPLKFTVCLTDAGTTLTKANKDPRLFILEGSNGSR